MVAKRREVLGLLGAALIAGTLLAACTGSIAAPEGWSGPVVVENVLYIGARDGHILALDRSKLARIEKLTDKSLKNSDALVWQFPRSDQKLDTQAIYSNPVVQGDTVYAAVNLRLPSSGPLNGNTYEGRIYALDATNKGSEVWTFKTAGQIYSDPLLAGGVLYLTDDKGWLYALDTITGLKKWTFKLSSGRLWATPALANGVLYVSGMDKKVYAVSADNGTQVWSTPFNAGGAIASSPLIVGDTVYVGAFDRKMHAIDRATGQGKSNFDASDWIWNNAVSVDGLIYFGTLGGRYYALRSDTLAPVWQFPSDSDQSNYSAFRGTPVLAGDKLVLTTRNGNVLVLNRKTGDVLSSVSVEAKVLASPAVSSDGKIYIADISQQLHQLPLPKA